MLLNQHFEYVDGPIDTNRDRLICVGNYKYGRVSLCVKSSMNVEIARIELHSGDRLVKAQKAFNDAHKLGEEIANRWNDALTFWGKGLPSIPRAPQRQDSLGDQLSDLTLVAERLGMYDAVDWLKAQTPEASAPSKTLIGTIDKSRYDHIHWREGLLLGDLKNGSALFVESVEDDNDEPAR